jgi:hypothetical protein
LSDLPAFKKYNGVVHGATLIDDNYSIWYNQKGTSNEYMLAFEEVYSINHKAQFSLIDSCVFKLEPKQQISTRNCRFNGEYDNEIVVIFISENAQKEAKILYAWRFNRKTLKIEPLELSKTQYKVADQELFHWK